MTFFCSFCTSTNGQHWLFAGQEDSPTQQGEELRKHQQLRTNLTRLLSDEAC